MASPSIYRLVLLRLSRAEVVREKALLVKLTYSGSFPSLFGLSEWGIALAMLEMLIYISIATLRVEYQTYSKTEISGAAMLLRV